MTERKGPSLTEILAAATKANVSPDATMQVATGRAKLVEVAFKLERNPQTPAKPTINKTR